MKVIFSLVFAVFVLLTVAGIQDQASAITNGQSFGNKAFTVLYIGSEKGASDCCDKQFRFAVNGQTGESYELVVANQTQSLLDVQLFDSFLLVKGTMDKGYILNVLNLASRAVEPIWCSQPEPQFSQDRKKIVFTRWITRNEEGMQTSVLMVLDLAKSPTPYPVFPERQAAENNPNLYQEEQDQETVISNILWTDHNTKLCVITSKMEGTKPVFSLTTVAIPSDLPGSTVIKRKAITPEKYVKTDAHLTEPVGFGVQQITLKDNDTIEMTLYPQWYWTTEKVIEDMP